MDKEGIIRSLRELAQYLEIDGENPFKVRSYIKAAETLEHTDDTIEQLIETGKLRSLEGIGEAIEKKIIAWAHNEPVPALEKVRSKYPSSLLELFYVQSLGAKRIRALYEHLHITNIDELYNACLRGDVASVPGFNKKIESKIIESIEFLREWRGYYLLSDGLNLAESFIRELGKNINLENIFIVGSLRRYCDTVRNINLLIVSDNKERMLNTIHIYDNNTTVIDSRTVKMYQFPIPIFLHLSHKEDLGIDTLLLTGSKEYIEKINKMLTEKDFVLNKDGLYKEKNQKINIETEHQFYQVTGLPYLPPELRENFADMDFVFQRALELVRLENIQGIVHCHTIYSDGQNSIEELAEYCINREFKYLVICDHSQSAGYAHGLSIKDIENQHQEIEKLNEIYKPFKILKGIECDIKTDGSLDYPNEILATFDMVIGSVHTKLEMDKNTATSRLLKAIENPFLDVIGHPTGKLLLSRKGYPIDIETIAKACVSHQVAIEINANPLRLDLDWRNIYKAVQMNTKFIISVDAHNLEGIEDLKYGVYTARKGTLLPKDILNCMNLEDMLTWLKEKKSTL